MEIIESGNMKIEWARNHMPVLAIVREKFEREKAAERAEDRNGPACGSKDMQSL